MSRADPPLTVDRIKRAVASHYGIHLSDLEGRCQQWWAAHPRHVAIYLSRKLISAGSQPMSFPAIGRRFERDHSTAMMAYKQVEKRLADGHEETCRAVAVLTAELTGEGL